MRRENDEHFCDEQHQQTDQHMVEDDGVDGRLENRGTLGSINVEAQPAAMLLDDVVGVAVFVAALGHAAVFGGGVVDGVIETAVEQAAVRVVGGGAESCHVVGGENVEQVG